MEARRNYFARYVMTPMAILSLATVFGCKSPGSSGTAKANATMQSALALPPPQTTAPENFIGVVIGRNTADLTPRFDGKVREVHVRLGDRVHKGDLLATFDLPAVQSESRMAEVVEKIAPEIDFALRMVVVEATLEGQTLPGAIIAGLMARVTLTGR